MVLNGRNGLAERKHSYQSSSYSVLLFVKLNTLNLSIGAR